jgi:hypothetical protein
MTLDSPAPETVTGSGAAAPPAPETAAALSAAQPLARAALGGRPPRSERVAGPSAAGRSAFDHRPAARWSERPAAVGRRVQRLPALASRRLARLDAPGYTVLAVALGSFVGSLVLRAVLFPQGSGDGDEAAYVLQARMLLDGRLTLDTRTVEPFFQPWLTGVHGNHVFTKYLPGWPALLAVSQALFGTMAVAPAAVAACWVIGTYLLARELFDDRWTALVAAVFLALSPLVLLHTVLPLAYACCAAALTLACALLLRGARTGARATLIGGGALVGFALLIRPFDTLLVVIPLVAFVVAQQRRTFGKLRHGLVWSTVGAAPLVAILLAYCWYVTGSPLRLPLSASDPLDTFGFGPRRIEPTEPTFAFTQRMAVQALIDTLQAGPSWYFGGPALIALAAVGLFVRRRRAQRLFLVATTGLVLVGYTFWWGSAFAMPGLRNGLGPHYHLAAFTPVVILAASGARWLWAWLPAVWTRLPIRPREARRLVRLVALALVAAGFVVFTLPTLPPRIDGQRYVNSANAALDALIPDHLPGPALVVVTPDQPSRYTQIPYQTLRNRPGLDGPIVYAADLGPATAALPDRMPGRTLYRLRPDELADPAVGGSPRGSFVPLRQITGSRIGIQVTVWPLSAASASPTGGSQLHLRLGTETRYVDLAATAAGASGAVTHTFAVTTGPAGPDEITTAGATLPAELVVGFTTGVGSGASTWEERIPLVRRPAGDLAMLAPGLGWRRLPSIAPGVESPWVAASVRPALDVALTS